MNRFQSALRKQNTQCPPIWLMRQAGRYHQHYQKIRKHHGFMELCKNPDLACEVTLGPIEDFDFDAAILFSDLLFPLEAMGMSLSYPEGKGPTFDQKIQTLDDLRLLRGGARLVEHLEFQALAMKKIRTHLDPNKGLLGFVGGPLTLYCYAVEGRHQGSLQSAREGMKSGLWEGFLEKSLDLIVENVALQIEAGADTVAVMDTCAGEWSPDQYAQEVGPSLKILFERIKSRCPGSPTFYYSKGTSYDHWKTLESLAIDGFGFDWRTPLSGVIHRYHSRFAIQGNIDPHWLFLGEQEFEEKVREVFSQVLALPENERQGWISGLGHGIMPGSSERNVKRLVQIQREVFNGVSSC